MKTLFYLLAGFLPLQSCNNSTSQKDTTSTNPQDSSSQVATNTSSEENKAEETIPTKKTALLLGYFVGDFEAKDMQKKEAHGSIKSIFPSIK